MSGYVFVACGSHHHLDRLDRARQALAGMTDREILVVTDERRNARPLDGSENIVDVSTDPDWSDQQAAIDLKTRLPELVDRDGIWCYLDTDVIAIDPGVDEIFSAFAAPITFARNLTRPGATLRRFSPYAVECACSTEMRRLEDFFTRLDEISKLHTENDNLAHLEDEAFYENMVFRGRRKFLLWGPWRQGEARIHDGDGNLLFEQLWRQGRPQETTYHFPNHAWRLVQTAPESGDGRFEKDRGHQFRFHADSELHGGGFWQDEAEDSFRETLDGEAWWFRANRRRRRRGPDPAGIGHAWFDASDQILGECDHLAEALERDFGIDIPDRRWQEWNGGVFLFTNEASEFFARWHDLCLDIFDRPGWKVRDQGALVGVAHLFGMTSHTCLPQRFNRIVDPHDPASREMTLEELRAAESPSFLHLIHGGLGERDLPIWRDLDRLLAVGP